MQTQRLVLRRFTAEDWQDLYEYLSDEEIVRYEPYSVFSKQQAIREAANRANNDAFLAVCLKDGGKMIGNIYFSKQSHQNYELGYVLNRAFQGRGYATEACVCVMDDAFQNKGAHRVAAMCNPDNAASWKLMERLHMRREAHHLQNIYFSRDEEGRPDWIDTYVYAILKSEWMKWRGQL